ncbi:uncharacterized protein ISCGN_022590 [Ixodes scapularis]
MNTTSQQDKMPPTSIVYVQAPPRTPANFSGNLHEDVDDWPSQYKRVARFNKWGPEQSLRNVYFALEGTARTWYKNHEALISSREEFQVELQHTFANQQRRQHAEELLQARTHGSNESITSFVDDVLCLINRADPNASEEKKLLVLMRGVRESTFGGLVRSPPTTDKGFITEATNIERALQTRAANYHRVPGVAVPTPSSCTLSPNIPGISEIIRDIVCEELKELVPCYRMSSFALDRRDCTRGDPANDPARHSRGRCTGTTSLDLRLSCSSSAASTTAGKQTTPTADALADDSGCAGSTCAPIMVNALRRSTSTCDDISRPSLHPAESSGCLCHDVQLRRCTDPDIKACCRSLVARETRRNNPWRQSYRRRPTPRSSTNVGGPPPRTPPESEMTLLER